MFARLPYCVNADTRHPKRGRLLFAPLLGQMSCFHVSQVKYSTFNMLGKILAIQGGCKKCFAAPKKLFRPPLTSLRSFDRRQPFQNTKDFALHFSNENSSHSVDWKNLRNDLQRASTCPVHFSCDNFAIQRLSSRCFFSPTMETPNCPRCTLVTWKCHLQDLALRQRSPSSFKSRWPIPSERKIRRGDATRWTHIGSRVTDLGDSAHRMTRVTRAKPHQVSHLVICPT